MSGNHSARPTRSGAGRPALSRVPGSSVLSGRCAAVREPALVRHRPAGLREPARRHRHGRDRARRTRRRWSPTGPTSWPRATTGRWPTRSPRWSRTDGHGRGRGRRHRLLPGARSWTGCPAAAGLALDVSPAALRRAARAARPAGRGGVGRVAAVAGPRRRRGRAGQRVRTAQRRRVPPRAAARRAAGRRHARRPTTWPNWATPGCSPSTRTRRRRLADTLGEAFDPGARTAAALPDGAGPGRRRTRGRHGPGGPPRPAGAAAGAAPA